MKKLILTLLLASTCSLGVTSTVFGEDRDEGGSPKTECDEGHGTEEGSENQG